MQDLQDFLNSPKLRGNLGETVLNDLLSQILPKQAFSLQHRFQSGDIVDAAIKTQSGIIPIDSKFPMENFTKMNQSDSSKERDQYHRQFINDVKNTFAPFPLNIFAPKKEHWTLLSCIFRLKPFTMTLPPHLPRSRTTLKPRGSYLYLHPRSTRSCALF